MASCLIRQARVLFAVLVVAISVFAGILLVVGRKPPPLAVPARSLLTIEARQVPLPPGNWTQLAQSVGESEISTVLVRRSGRDIDAAVIVRVNRMGRAVHWGVPEACGGAPLYQPRRVLYLSDHDGFCGYASFVDGSGPLTNVPIDDAWKQGQKAAVDRGWNMPATWHSATFWVTDPVDSMQLRYLFHPWPINQASPPDLPEWRRTQHARLTDWIDAALPVVSLASRQRLKDGSSPELPEIGTVADAKSTALAKATPAGGAAGNILAKLSGRAATMAAGSRVGAMIGGRGCVEALPDGEYMLTVAWQGLTPLAAPPTSVGCGANQYDRAGTACTADLCRRAVTTIVRIAALR